MQNGSDLMTKAKEAKSAEELLALAKENGIELTAEEAERYYGKLHATGELADDELDNVSGGGCGSDEEKYERSYRAGDHVLFWENREYNRISEGVIVEGRSESFYGESKYYIEHYTDYTTCWMWVEKADIIKLLY